MYLSIERQTGITPPQLEAPPLPLELAHVWAWFLELSEARASGSLGTSPITFGEMLAWAQLTDRKPRPFEITLLRALDRALLAAA